MVCNSSSPFHLSPSPSVNSSSSSALPSTPSSWSSSSVISSSSSADCLPSSCSPTTAHHGDPLACTDLEGFALKCLFLTTLYYGAFMAPTYIATILSSIFCFAWSLGYFTILGIDWVLCWLFLASPFLRLLFLLESFNALRIFSSAMSYNFRSQVLRWFFNVVGFLPMSTILYQ